MPATWNKESDTTAADGVRMRNPDAGAAKLDDCERITRKLLRGHFNVEAGKAYHLWLRMKADNNSTANDSVFVQFTNSRDRYRNDRLANRHHERSAVSWRKAWRGRIRLGLE